jgi:hypothetical protein
MDIPVPEAPQTIRQNWIPFLTFFFLRVLSIYGIVSGVARCVAGAGKGAYAPRRGCFGESRTEDIVQVGDENGTC